MTQKIDNMVSQEEGYYFITSRGHPHSNENFSYINKVIYVQSSHQAYTFIKGYMEDVNDPAVNEFDYSVDITKAINTLVADLFDIETMEELRALDIEEVKKAVQKHRRSEPIITESDLLEVGERQEKIDKHEMGEDVDGVISVDKESDEK